MHKIARHSIERELAATGEVRPPVTEIHLPEQFRDLEPFVTWSLATESERSARRQRSTMAEIETFYHTLLPRMDAVLSCLAAYPDDDDLPEQVRSLFHLALALAEVAPAVENYGQPSVIDGYDVARLIVAREPRSGRRIGSA